jgi:YVTN family beta-propeller protein
MSGQTQNGLRYGACAGFIAIGVALLSVAYWTGGPVNAAAKPETSTSEDYASPLEVLLSPDGARLFVLCQQSNEVRVLNATSFATIKNIEVGRVPRGFSLSPKGDKLFVTNAWDDTISVIDTKALEVINTWPVGAEPSSVVEDRAGKRLFVANRISNDIAVLDAQTGVEEKRLAAGRGASYLALSPDGSRIYVTHVYPKIVPRQTGFENRLPPESEITVIDAERAIVVDRIQLHAIAGVFHLALSPDGRLGVAAEYHPKNLLPLAHVDHGGAFTYSLELFGTDVGKTPVEVPLDELDRYASQPFGVAITPDKSRIYVTCGGSEIVTVVDVPRLLRFIHTHNGPFAQDLSASANYVVTRIPVGLNPRGLALSRDGRRLFVANRLDDTVSVIDTRANRAVSTITLAGSNTIASPHFNEGSVNIASGAVEGNITCSKCHIDGRTQSQIAPTSKDLENLIDKHKRLMVPSLASSGSKQFRHCAAANRYFIPRVSLSGGRSVVPTATSIPHSTASNGIWSRTDLAATPWTTRYLRASRIRNRINGREPIQTFPPSADLGPRNTSGALRTTIIQRLPTWPSTFAVWLRAQIAGGRQTAS